jgi:RNA polymerase sigma factor (sigma-70 family)
LLDEKDLILALQHRSEPAFRQLVAQYQGRVYNTILCLVQSPEEAEDLAQEVFIEVHASVGTFRGEAKLSTWLYRLATNKALEYQRRQKAPKRFAFLTSLFGANDELVHHPPDFRHPGVVLEQQEQAATLFNAIARLADTQRTALTLHHFEGLSYAEIADIMQTTVPSVESLLFRAKTRLRSLLKQHYQQLMYDA